MTSIKPSVAVEQRPTMTTGQYFPRISSLLPNALLLLVLLIATPFTLARETCPKPWVEFLDSCYLFERGSSQQHAAATLTCADHNALLLSADTSEEHNFVVRQLNEIADKAVFASNLKWYTSGDAAKVNCGFFPGINFLVVYFLL